jgi:hypothetical protein
MIKRTLLLIALAAALGTTVPQNAAANHECAYGRITALGPNSISVYVRDDNLGVVTFTVDSRTHYTKWITQGPWQQNIQFNRYDRYDRYDRYGRYVRYGGYDVPLLDIGQLVAVHGGHDGRTAAFWVQVATDVPRDLRYHE